MSEPPQASAPQPTSSTPASSPASAPLFSPPPVERNQMPLAVWGVAGLVVLLLVGILIFSTHKKSSGPLNAVQPLDPYASSLTLSQIAMSESTSLSGGKSTYLDGHIQNNGPKTVTGITVQVLFHNDEQLPPQVETVPLSLIRTHEPYVDTQPVSAAPLKPGDDREFRLIFESIPQNWNVQTPEIRVISVSSR